MTTAGLHAHLPVGQLRLLTWNVAGAMDLLHAGDRMRRWLGAKADLLAFSETGHEGQTPPALPGFCRLASTPRPHDCRHGGVALYVRSSIAPAFQVIRDQAEFGLLWFRCRLGVDNDIYGAVAYLPPPSSTYYAREEGGLSADAHWDALASGVAQYSPKGRIIVMGDLNARPGTATDWPSSAALAAARVTGIGVRAAELATRVQPRMAADTGGNAAGPRLVRLCQEQGLVILNGRTCGDIPGRATFLPRGRDGSSTVDYFLASPSLAFHEDGRRRQQVSMAVIPLERCPPPPERHYHLRPLPCHARSRPEPCGPPTPRDGGGRFRRDSKVRVAWGETGGLRRGLALGAGGVCYRSRS
jgi:exonuclease III